MKYKSHYPEIKRAEPSEILMEPQFDIPKDNTVLSLIYTANPVKTSL